MKPFDLHLYLVLDAATCGDKLLATAEAALAAGITMLQLRGDKQRWHKRDWYEAARALKPLCAAAQVPFIINDQVDIALAVDADGVHVGQDDLPADEVRRLIGPDKLIGVSVSDFSELAAVPAGVDYLGIGPIFPTGTKSDAGAAIGIAGFGELAAAAALPAVAIGGVKAQHCADLFAAGAKGVAVVSAICGQPDPAQATAALADVIRAARTQR